MVKSAIEGPKPGWERRRVGVGLATHPVKINLLLKGQIKVIMTKMASGYLDIHQHTWRTSTSWMTSLCWPTSGRTWRPWHQAWSKRQPKWACKSGSHCSRIPTAGGGEPNHLPVQHLCKRQRCWSWRRVSDCEIGCALRPIWSNAKIDLARKINLLHHYT